jgi:hypothetical protein
MSHVQWDIFRLNICVLKLELPTMHYSPFTIHHSQLAAHYFTTFALVIFTSVPVTAGFLFPKLLRT